MRDTLTDPWLGTRPFPTSPLELVQDQHRLLCHYRDDGRAPSAELLADIAAYSAILEAADAAARAEEYVVAARPPHRQRPRTFARAKGWIR